MSNLLKICIVVLAVIFVHSNVIGQLANTEYPLGIVSVNSVDHGSFLSDTLGTVTTTSEIGTYGGWIDKNVGATGYFHTKQVDSVWYLVDPEGYLFYTVGVTTVDTGGGFEMPSTLRNWGINTMGNWSNETITNYPFVPRYSFLSNFKSSSTYRKELFNQDIFPVFDADFASWIDTKAEAFVADYKDNSWVVGYQTDNELRFHYVDINNYLALDETDLHYIAAYDWMMAKHDFISPVSDEDIYEFRAYVAEVYMSTVNAALKKYDPNHMNLGCRIHAAVKYDSLLVKAICNNVDVNTINFYGAWEPSTADMDMWINAGKPFFISEFYTKAQDSGLGNEDGAGWAVYTQQDRVNHFENFAMTCLSHRGSVGWTWFRYMDKNDANKGIVSENYEVYEDLVASMQNLSKDVYNLRNYLLGIEPQVPVTAVYISSTTLSMAVGDTITLKAIVVPETATIKTVTWTSNNSSILTISDNGFATAISEGTAKITITTLDGNKTAYCSVSVTPQVSIASELYGQNNPQIFPNPVNNLLTICFPNESEFMNYTIYSSTGLVIQKGLINSNTLNINVLNMSKGLYFINFEGGNNAYRSKFIKL
jgi:hypothetical protein